MMAGTHQKSLNVPIVGSTLLEVGLDTRLCWWIRHPQAATNTGRISPFFTSHLLLAGGSYCIRGHGSGAKENAPAASSCVGAVLRLPDPPYVESTQGNSTMKTPSFRTLKRYSAVSINNLIHRYSVTAYSLSEARALLPTCAIITAWAPVKEALA